jgi:ribosome biogenesis GTPase A
MEEGIKRIQLFGVPNTGKTSLLNKLLNSDKITSKIPGTTIRVSEFTYRNKIKVFDMPGLHYTDIMYNLISKPSLKSILTWNKFYSPPLMTHSCFIYGGKIEA